MDNLKLGYGGTQAEMARLINDSGVLGDTMEVTAETVNQVSFDKIIEAIHVVQTEMGITGTTAKEASSTIEGSINTMKGAWENLLTAIAADGFDVGVYVENFVDSIITVMKNLAPRIQEILPNIAAAIDMLVDQLAPYVAGAIETLLPMLISGSIDIAIKLAENIPEAFEVVKNAIIQVFNEALESAPAEVQDKIYGLMDAFQILLPVVAGVTGAIIAFKTAITIAAIIDGVSKAITAFKTANEAATIAQAALNAVMNMNPFVLIATLIAGVVAALITLWMTNEDFRNAVIEIFNSVLAAISGFVSGVVNFFTVTIPNALNAVITFVSTNWQNILLLLVNPFAGAFKLLYENCEWFRNVIDTLVQNIKTAFNNMKDAISNTVDNIRDAIVNGLQKAIDFITELPGRAFQWGKDFIGGFVDGIKSMISAVTDAVKGVADKVTSYLHFSRPDTGPLREYEKWMPDMMQGLAKGITDNVWRIEKAAGGVAIAASSKLNGIDMGGDEKRPTGQNRGYGGGNIYIYGDVSDPDVIARRIRIEQRYGLAGAK